MSARIRISDKKIEQALRLNGGFIKYTAEALGIAPITLRNRIKKSPRLQQVVQEVQDDLIELAELKLIEKIKEGNLPAIFFYLKCKGKHKGYVERREVTGADGAPVQVVIKNA